MLVTLKLDGGSRSQLLPAALLAPQRCAEVKLKLPTIYLTSIEWREHPVHVAEALQSGRIRISVGSLGEPASLVPCTQPALQLGGSVFVVPALVEPTDPCSPPLKGTELPLAGEPIADFPVRGAHLDHARSKVSVMIYPLS